MAFGLRLAKSFARMLHIEEQARAVWRRLLYVSRGGGAKEKLKKSAPKNNHKPLPEPFDKSVFINKNRENLLGRAASLPADDKQRLKIGRHLFRLRNFAAATTVLEPMDIHKLELRDLFFLGKAKQFSNKGVESDQLLMWFLRQPQALDLSDNEKIDLAEWVYHSGIDVDVKFQRFADLRHSAVKSSSVSDKVRRHIRFNEFRLGLVSGDRVDVLEYAELHRLNVEDPDYQLRFVPHLKAMGYIVEARDLLERLLKCYGVHHPGIVSAVLRFDSSWPGIDIFRLPEDYIGRHDTLQLASEYRKTSEEYEFLYEASIKNHVSRYAPSNIYIKDKILRSLLKVDLFDQAETLILNNDRLPDTVLPAHGVAGLAYFVKDNFKAAKDCFMRVLREDPSDPIASTGLRLSLPRVGGSMDSILRVREQVGYGSGGIYNGTISSERTITLLMSGRYMEGQYAKRHAAHWRLLKDMYSERFLNFEPIPHGDCISKSLFVIGDEGVGDEVRTAQFYSFLSNHFGKVTISCDPRLIEIFKRSFPSIDFVAVERYRKGMVERGPGGNGERLSRMNLKLSQYLTEECKPLMDSADLVTFGQTLFFNYFSGVIPRLSGGAYLNCERKTVSRCENNSQKLRVGILWRSHVQSVWRKLMYLKVEDFAPLLDVDGIELWSIQHAIDQDEYLYCKEHGIRLIEDIDLFNDFEGLASYLKEMDIVIGISSLPAELAAAVGTPVWMLGFSPENYFLRTKGGKIEEDQLTLNSKIIAPKWIDFTASTKSCIDMVMREVCNGLTDLVCQQTSVS